MKKKDKMTKGQIINKIARIHQSDQNPKSWKITYLTCSQLRCKEKQQLKGSFVNKRKP